MSYILDALRRADSEREQGAVPSLHSKQVPPALADADDVETRHGVPTIGWIAMGGSALAGAALVWFLTGRSDAPPDFPPPPVAAAAAPVMPTPAPAPAPATQAQYEPPPVVAPAPPMPARTAVAPAPAPLPRLAAEARTAAKPTPAKPADAAPAEDAPVPSASELPDDIRRQLPTLSVSGATYSKTASSRMLILNGQVFHEGDKVTNELTLEQIRLKSAVLSFRGTRYSISY